MSEPRPQDPLHQRPRVHSSEHLRGQEWLPPLRCLLRRADQALRGSQEVRIAVAICTGRVPTITALNRRYPVVGVVLVGALALHFWTPAPI